MDCLASCFGKSKGDGDSERDPLLPKRSHGRSSNGNVARNGQKPAPPMETTALDKVIDAITAVRAGKLPSQDQIQHALHALISSEFLQDEGGPSMAGKGPLSKEGRKVLGDVRDLVQAFLEFGLEKNADDRIQETYFQLLHLTSDSHASKGPSKSVSVSETQEGSTEDSPLSQQIAFDAQTFIHAIRTLIESTLTSSTFRTLILDFFAVVNELMESAAKDVKRAAGRVQKVAEDIETRARGDHDVIDESTSKGETSTNDLKEKGKAIVDKAQDAARDVRSELEAQVEEATDDAKERFLSRIRQMLSRLQKDPSSRAAMKSLLTLFQKYANSLSDLADESKSSMERVSSQITDTLDDTSQSTYPPDPYGNKQKRGNPAFSPSDLVMSGVKELLERLGQRHSLDPLLAALRRVFIDLNEDVPKTIQTELKQTIEKHVEEAKQESTTTTPALTPIQTQPPFSEQIKGKGRSRKAARKARKRSQRVERSEPDSFISDAHHALSPSESQNVSPSRHETTTSPNVVRLYFTRLGDYFNKALEEPEWATSSDGAKTIESLFDDGVDLVNIVGLSIIEVEDKVTTTAPSSDNEQTQGTSTTDDDEKAQSSSDRENDRIRRKFKKDLQSLLKETEDFISALQNDKTTMKVWRAWQSLGEDGQRLITVGGKRAYGYMHNLSPWTEWIGWAVPRLLKMLPLSAIPIPTVEFKSPYVEGALHALFVQGMARGKDNVGQGSLIPDEVVVKEYTEFRFNMVDRPLHSSMPMAEVPTGTLHRPNLDTTARLHVHANGIRAKIERVGYYFQYTGALLGYEDQGILGVDLAIDAPHEGLGIDIELETDVSQTTELQSPGVPQIIVEGEDGTTAESTPPVAVAADRLVQGPPKPLFNVLSVNVMMRGLKVTIDHSKHWILNKLCFQPIAGPAIATALQSVLEEQIHAKLQSLALSLGEIVQDASRRSEWRKLRCHEQGKEVKDGAMDVLGDFWGALVDVGPHAFGYDNGPDHQGNERTETTVDATSRGLVYTSKQVVTDEPRGTPAMTVDPATGETTRVDLTMEDIGGSAGRRVEGEETTVAVGLGGQLFPDKVDETASYGSTDDAERDPLGERIDAGVNEAQNAVGHVGDRWVQSSKRENKTSDKTWRSKAFDIEL